MKCNYYFDVEIKNLRDDEIASSILPEIVRISGKVIKSLHVFNMNTEELYKNKIAVAFPKYIKEYRKFGNLIRFFAEEKILLQNFWYFIKDSDVNKNIQINVIKSIKDENNVSYYAFVADKLKSRLKKVTSKKNGQEFYHGLTNEKYEEHIEKIHKCPNLRFRSTSNKQFYSLFIDKKLIKNFSQEKNDNGELNSFGFSKSEKLIYLPMFR